MNTLSVLNLSSLLVTNWYHDFYCLVVLAQMKVMFVVSSLFSTWRFCSREQTKKVGTLPTCSRRIFSPANFNQSRCWNPVFALRRANKVAKWKIGFTLGLYAHRASYVAGHVKISRLVASLQTSRQQLWNRLLTTCNNLVNIIRLVTRLFQQGCYNHDTTILLQPCVVNLVTFLLYHDCIRVVRTTL